LKTGILRLPQKTTPAKRGTYIRIGPHSPPESRIKTLREWKEPDMFNKKKEAKKEVTLDDVIPEHPNEYPAKHLKEKLDSRREALADIKDHNPSEGLQETTL
jgi:hypothetical protein